MLCVFSGFILCSSVVMHDCVMCICKLLPLHVSIISYRVICVDMGR